MISAQQLTDLYVTAGVLPERISVFDPWFVLPTPHWVQNTLAAALNQWFFDLGAKGQPRPKFDCNKVSKTASTIADWCWLQTPTENLPPSPGLAVSPDDAVVPVGLFGYASNNFGLHMIVTVPHRNADHGLYLAFYEPQPAAPENEAVFTPVCLTPRTLDSDEIKSCRSCLFV